MQDYLHLNTIIYLAFFQMIKCTNFVPYWEVSK